MLKWEIEHYAIDGRPLGRVAPIDLNWSKDLTEVNTITYKLSKGHILAGPDYTYPYRTDWALFRGETKMDAGIHTNVKAKRGTETIDVSGREWMHYFERRLYPFDPTQPLLYKLSMFQQDVLDIVRTILTNVLAQPYSLDFTWDADIKAGVLANYKIELGDTQTVFHHIQQLTEQEPGFDWTVSPERHIEFFPTQKGTPSIFKVEDGKNLVDIDYENRGLIGNWTLGLGAGSSTKRGAIYADQDSMILQRRHDNYIDLGDIIDPNLVSSMTLAEHNVSKHPIKVAGVKVRPEGMPFEDLWAVVDVGDLVRVVSDVGYDQLDVDYRVMSMTLELSNQGDETVTLVFASDDDDA